ncbi:MAG: hypothetical protein EOL87_14310, partial [Spartobacteria bacterium]|nr:hypothetical protein [Spartobacteria bacterium]
MSGHTNTYTAPEFTVKGTLEEKSVVMLTHTTFANQLCCAKRILVLGATTDERLEDIGDCIARIQHEAQLVLLRPTGRPARHFDAFHDIRPGREDSVVPADIENIADIDTLILAINHVTRAVYRSLIRSMCATGCRTFVFTSNGLQIVDQRDANESIYPVFVQHSLRNSHRCSAGVSLFFRPSDETVRTLASQRLHSGHTVWNVDTVSAFEFLLPYAQRVFFDWCITDYTALMQVVQLSMEYPCIKEAFLALDMADMAEDAAMSNRIIEWNCSALPQLDHVYVLKSRQHLIERYQLNRARVTLTHNLIDSSAWGGVYKGHARPGSPALTFVYHGLFYYWHEVAAFIPVYRELSRYREVHWDLFGRVHEDIYMNGMPLHPKKYKETLEGLRLLQSLPHVAFHGFQAPS